MREKKVTKEDAGGRGNCWSAVGNGGWRQGNRQRVIIGNGQKWTVNGGVT